MNLQEAIDAMGDTPEKIRAFLVERGCTGAPGEPDRCPIANYITSLGWEQVLVGDYDIVADSFAIATPERIRTFITLFDTRQMPELEDK